jgi:phosphatidylserine synthase
MGAVVAACYLTWAKYGLSETLLAYAPALLAISAALMVSNLRLPKLKVRKSRAFNVLQFSNVAAAYVLAPLKLFPEYLCCLAVGYLFFGLAFGKLFPPPPAATEEEDEPQEQLA